MTVQSLDVQAVCRPINVRADLCHGCQTCMLGCSLYHEGQCYPGLARVAVRKDMARFIFDIRICQHCESPECLEACPSGAMSLDARGVVLLDDDVCIRCGSCAEACPYEVIFYNEREDRYLKCDLCAGRADGPLCAALCPVGALTTQDTPGQGEV